jgi:hypothetical protein
VIRRVQRLVDIWTTAETFVVGQRDSDSWEAYSMNIDLDLETLMTRMFKKVKKNK